MKDLLYLKDEQIKEFIQLLYYAYRETFSDPKDILSKIGEPYLRSNNPEDKSKTGLGLGLFIGKILLEKNFASVICRNSKTRSGAEVIIKWRNKDLFNIQ